ncbi:hypothetical protein, partial [Blastococcus sp. SYSU DS0539]
ELTLAISINQRNPCHNHKSHGTGYYLALTFGTLLSSQGADAHETRPISRPLLEAVFSMYTGLRSG